MNILILSCGTRNKIIQYFKQEIGEKGNVIATDNSELAPALYEADKYYITPKMCEDKYEEELLKICKHENIHCIFSLIDPELTVLIGMKETFNNMGIVLLVSEAKSIEKCLSKKEMYCFLYNNNIKTQKTFFNVKDFLFSESKQEVSFPVFIKPQKGSASIGIAKVETIEELNYAITHNDDFLIQEFMSGKEFGVDAYVDIISGEVVSIFIKEKLRMRSGETDKSVSIKNTEILILVKKLLKLIQFKGPIDIDIFEKNGEYYISEVNPRFGGGYPHAFEAGINFPKMVINNLNHKVNQPLFENYNEGIVMMKFSEIHIVGRDK